MAMKIYSYPGITAGDIMVKAGKAFVRVSFSGGYLNAKMKRPATFSTNNEVLQQIIENSDLYGRRIFLYRTYGPTEVEKDNAKEVLAPTERAESNAPAMNDMSGDPVSYPEVRTFADAVGVLKNVPGVKASQIRTLTGAKRVAAANGILFPNYTFEED